MSTLLPDLNRNTRAWRGTRALQQNTNAQSDHFGLKAFSIVGLLYKVMTVGLTLRTIQCRAHLKDRYCVLNMAHSAAHRQIVPDESHALRYLLPTKQDLHLIRASCHLRRYAQYQSFRIYADNSLSYLY